ncbi:MAG: hypothetical protein OXH78_04155 [Acidimicrobiaceae bacterium]|nr:hypothetical protein [Acidimicrobiaceae bacterium]
MAFIKHFATPATAVDKFAEWAVMTFVMMYVVYFAAGLMTGFSMDYEVHRNHMLVWAAVAGGVGFSACYGWLVYNRGVYADGLWAIPGSAKALWTLTTGAALWVAAVAVDQSRLNMGSVEYGELVPRIPVAWWMWIPLAIAASLSLLHASRRGVSRWAIASLPLQAMWWSAALLAPA